jgi:hypothetical protein
VVNFYDMYTRTGSYRKRYEKTQNTAFCSSQRTNTTVETSYRYIHTAYTIYMGIGVSVFVVVEISSHQIFRQRFA